MVPEVPAFKKQSIFHEKKKLDSVSSDSDEKVKSLDSDDSSLCDSNSLKTESSVEKHIEEDLYEELPVVCIPFTEFRNVENIIGDFCQLQNVNFSDQTSLTTYVLFTMETEMIAFNSKDIIQRIRQDF